MTKARDLANGATALSAVSATELAYLDGVTSAVQTQIDGKQAVNAAVSTTELGYLDGVTSAIQTQLDAKTAKSTLTTTGDIYYASAANTPARLGIGSTDQVLKVTAGIPAWATVAAGWSPNLTLLSTTTPGSADSVTINVSAYDYYVILWRGISSNAGAMYSLRINSSTNAAHYLAQLQILAKAVGQTVPIYDNVGTDRTSGNAAFYYFAKKGHQGSGTNYVDAVITVIGGKTTGAKSLQWTTNPSASGNYNAFGSSGNAAFDNGAAISSFTVMSSDGNFNAGTIEIYGG
jgi:hypothetical protein